MWHYTPQRFAKIYVENGKCWRCQTANAGFKLIWWECDAVIRFWSMIIDEIYLIRRTKLIYDLHTLKFFFTKCDDGWQKY